MKSVSVLSLAIAVQVSQGKYFKWLKLKKKFVTKQNSFQS